MPLVILLGDTSSHGGAVATAASKTKAEGKFIARVGDTFVCPIHGPNAIATGSEKNLCEGAQIARDGDLTGCGASLISSATKTDFD